jgi:drug/metabolite transporter (DMT)-like permease
MFLSKGVRYMLISGFFFTLMNVCVKLIPDIPSYEIVLFRSLITLVICLAYLYYYKIYIWGHQKKFLVLRGLFGAGSLIFYFELLQRIPLASATTIFFLAPIFTNIIGMFIVKERVCTMQWVFFLISFAGILLAKGFDPRISPVDLIIGITTSIFSGFAQNYVRKLGSGENPMVIILYFPMMTIPITGVISTISWKVPVNYDWIFLILIGVLTQVAQFYMTKSYQEEKISRVANLQYINIVYALILGFIIFHETFGILSYIGMFLAVAGVLMNLLYKKYPVSVSQQGE